MVGLPYMREFAREFYSSQAWRDCRDSFKKSKRGLCERCLEKGIYNAGDAVHHKIHLTPQNITDPNITLSWDNLMLLCADCHAEIHKRQKRYKFDECGHCVVNSPLKDTPKGYIDSEGLRTAL